MINSLKGVHLVRYYGLYSSRTRGKLNKIAENSSQQIDLGQTFLSDEEEHSSKESRKAWARLIQKVYEVNPLICLKCESEMRVVAIIQDPYKENSPPALKSRRLIPLDLYHASFLAIGDRYVLIQAFFYLFLPNDPYF